MNKIVQLELTADIVAAHVGNNKVAVGDMQDLITQVHLALAALGEAALIPDAVRTPAVPVRASIKPDYIVCLACGRKQKTLKRHLQSAHQLTPAAYRSAYELPPTYPMTSANYSAQRTVLAKAAGFGRKPEARVRPTLSIKA